MIFVIFQKLQSKCRQHQDSIKKTLGSAQSLLERNKDVTRKPGEQQQYQRLRFNTSDLKVRFEAVSSAHFDKQHTVKPVFVISTWRDHLAFKFPHPPSGRSYFSLYKQQHGTLMAQQLEHCTTKPPSHGFESDSYLCL